MYINYKVQETLEMFIVQYGTVGEFNRKKSKAYLFDKIARTVGNISTIFLT